MSDKDGLADLFLGVFLGLGFGFCVIGLAVGILFAIFPDYAPNLLAWVAW